ncbi:MAG: S-layer homology domain-containing protein, partial [Parcubacteria group bacterium]
MYQTQVKTKTKTKTIVAVAAVALAVGPLAYGIITLTRGATKKAPTSSVVDKANLANPSTPGTGGGSEIGPTNTTIDRGQMAQEIVNLMNWKLTKNDKPVFSDVTKDSPYFAAVQALATKRITSGCGDGKYCVKDLATRGQAVVFLVKAKSVKLVEPTTPSFSDVPKTHMFYKYIETAKSLGWIGGYGNGKFGPDDPISREHWNIIKNNVVGKKADTTAPKITALSITPTTIDTTSGDQTVTLNATITDDISGVCLPANTPGGGGCTGPQTQATIQSVSA